MADAYKANAVVSQSGGPTAVINASLVGVIEEAAKHPEILNLYGSVHAVAGIIDENFVDPNDIAQRPDTGGGDSGGRGSGVDLSGSESDLHEFTNLVWVSSAVQIANWPRTIKLVASHQGNVINMEYDRLQDIPPSTVPVGSLSGKSNPYNVNGNCWVVRKFQGIWYISTFDYLRRGQTSKHIGISPDYRFTPKSGDPIGVLVSTKARETDGTVVNGTVYRERSNISWFTW